MLVNNAGIPKRRKVQALTPEVVEKVMTINYFSPVRLTLALLPRIIERKGRIVNISSVDGLRGQNGLIAYASSKWAVRGMTRVAAIEFGRFGIRVNAVCPEAGSGEMIAPYIPEGVDVEKVVPLGQPRLSTQKERSLADLIGDVARMVLFLASDESASCTGADFPVDGGNTAGRRRGGMPGA